MRRRPWEEKVMNIISKILVVGTMLGLTALSAKAETVTLESPLRGGTVTSGDKLFSGFTYAGTGRVPTAALINITPITLDGNFGIQVQGGFSAFNGETNDVLITYTVTVTDPTKAISDAHISSNAAVLQGEVGAVAITDSFTEFAETINSFTAVPGTTKLTDSIVFDHTVTVLHASKDILLTAAPGALVVLSAINQTYSQVTVEIPSPAALPVGLVGLGGLALLRRRK